MPVIKISRSRRRSLAHNGDGESSLCDWVKSSLWALRDKGRLTFIIRADRTDDVMAALHFWRGRRDFTISVMVLCDQPGGADDYYRPKGVKGAMALLPGLVLHRPSGALTCRKRKKL